MRAHCKLKHDYLPPHTKTPCPFDATKHSVQGMPQCQLCKRKFFRWQHLQKHITKGACEALGGESFVRNPVLEEVRILEAVTEDATPPQTLAENATVLPLVRQPEESWPLRPGARKQLLEHCVLCGMWLASHKHVKQHMNKAHAAELRDTPQQSLILCRTFKSQLTRGRACLFCQNRVGGPRPARRTAHSLVSAHNGQTYRAGFAAA